MAERIWFNKDISLQQLQGFNRGTMSAHLAMEWVEIGDRHLAIRMPVDERTKQPYGFLHGGASCALAETAGSVASHLVVDPSEFYCVGLEINANHLRPVTEGYVTAVATAIHLGRSTHVWDIRITDSKQRLACICRLTVAIVKKEG